MHKMNLLFFFFKFKDLERAMSQPTRVASRIYVECPWMNVEHMAMADGARPAGRRLSRLARASLQLQCFKSCCSNEAARHMK